MWDHIASAFDNFFSGGKWGALIGGIIGALYALTTPSAIPGNEFYAMFTGGFLGAVGGSVLGAGVGAASGLVFGSGDTPAAPQAPAPEKEIEAEVARSPQPDPPSPNLPSIALGNRGTGAGRG